VYTAFNGEALENLTQAWTPVITYFGRCYRFVTDEAVVKPGTYAGLDF